MPDGLLVGGLAFVLGMTGLIWTATGLSGLFAHGSWPDGVSFTRTPTALRELLREPHDMAAAWPETPPTQLSGYGLFWGVFISQLMVLIVLTVFVLGTVARWRAVRRAARQRAAEEDAEDVRGAGAGAGREAYEGDGRGYGRGDGYRDTAAPAPPAYGNPGPQPPVPGPADGVPQQRPAPEPAPAPAPAGAVPEPQPTPVPAPPPTPAEANRPTQPAPQSPYATGLRIAPPDGAAAQAVREAEGAVLVVTGDTALYADTIGVRGKVGPAHVFDPAQHTAAPARLRWAPHRGCEDMPTARQRAAALLAPVRSPARADSAVHDAAETLLRCWLHAAAVAGEPFRQVHRWALSGSSKDAVRILRRDTAAVSGAAGELEATLTAHAERREAAIELVRRALNSVSQLHIRNACTPSRSDRIAWESFVAEGGTLYAVGEAIEAPHRGDPAAMPLVTALTSAVVEHGRRMAERSSAGRLDPPLTVVLDHPATVAPLPELPALLTDGAAAGLNAVALLRSEEEVRTWWPELLRGQS